MIDLSQIRIFVMEGKPEKALEFLEQIIAEKVLLYRKIDREVVSLKSRLTFVESSYRKGIIKIEDKQIELNRINDSILELVEILKKSEDKNLEREEIKFPQEVLLSTSVKKQQDLKNGDRKHLLSIIYKPRRIIYGVSFIGLIILILFITQKCNTEVNLKNENVENLKKEENNSQQVQKIIPRVPKKIDESKLIEVWKGSSAFMEFKNNNELKMLWFNSSLKENEIGSWALYSDTLRINTPSFKKDYLIDLSDDGILIFKDFKEEIEFEANRSALITIERNKLLKQIEPKCDLSEKYFRGNYSGEFINFYGKKGNIYEFSGKHGIEAFSGKVMIVGNEIFFLKGSNCSGKLTLSSTCRKLVGSMLINGQLVNEKVSINYHLR